MPTGQFVVDSCFTRVGGAPSRASLMLKAFNDPRESNCSFLGFYTLSIQRLETESTVDNVSFALDGSMSV